MAEQARDAGARAKRLQDLQKEWRDRLFQARSSAMLLRLVDSLFLTPMVTIPQVQSLLDVAYHTAASHVRKLAKAGILQLQSAPSYGKTYVAEKMLQAIE